MAVAWLAVTAAVVGLAGRLDQPTEVAAPDAARPEVGPVALLPDGAPAAGERLPPLAIVLDAPPPIDIGGLALEEQARRLRREAALTADPRVLVYLGAAHQRLAQRPEARAAFRDALQLDPGNVGARVGLALDQGAEGGAGLDRGAAALEELAATNPQSQLVAFNGGWLAVYRRDVRDAVAAWRRTIALDGGTPLGRSARQLLATVSEPTGGVGP